MVRNLGVLLLGGLLAVCAVPSWAQDAILGQMYGNGVHAYFSGDYVRAHQLLTAAIEAGSHDARCYYFRGLSYLRLGRPQEAEGDFQQGAKLESSDLNKTYSVAKSLERIQGAPRSGLERYRIEARMAVLQKSEETRKARYEEISREERRGVDSQVVKPAAPEAAAAPEAKGADNPFAVPAAPGDKPGAEKPGADKPPAAVPEKAAPAPADDAKKSLDDPFAAPAAKSAAEKPDAEKPAVEKPDAEAATPVVVPAAKDAPAPDDKAPAAIGAAAAPAKKGGFGSALGHALGRAIGGDENKTPAKPAVVDKPDAAPAPAKPAEAGADLFGAPTPKADATPAKAADVAPAKAEAKPSAKPAGEDPFGEPAKADAKPAKPAADAAPAKAEAKPAGEDPFAEPAKADTKPAAASDSKKAVSKPLADDPFKEESPAGDKEAAKAPAADKPAADKPATDKPAAKKAAGGDDPFAP